MEFLFVEMAKTSTSYFGGWGGFNISHLNREFAEVEVEVLSMYMCKSGLEQKVKGKGMLLM